MNLVQKWLTIIRPGMLIVILGGPGSGKSGLAQWLAEILAKEYDLEVWIHGIPPHNRKHYRGHVRHLDPIEDPSDAPNNAILTLEELSLAAHSRRSSSEGNVLLDQLKNIRRHKGLTIICVVQRGSEMDKNLAYSADVLLIKQPEPFQHFPGSDRPQFQPHLEKADELFKDPRIRKAVHWVYVNTLGELVENRLTSWWNEDISRSLGPGLDDLGMEGRKPLYEMDRKDRIKEALILKKEGKSSREVGRILGLHHTTILNYWNNYPKTAQPRLPEEEFESLARDAETEFIKRNSQPTPELPEEEEGEEPELEPEPVSLKKEPASTGPLGRCETGQHVFPEDGPAGKRPRYCPWHGTKIVWPDTKPSVAKDYKFPRALMERNFKGAGLDPKNRNEELKKWGSLGVGLAAGSTLIFPIDVIDKAIDSTDLTEHMKSRAKWLMRSVDLGAGIVGTIAGGVPILKGDAEWPHWLLSGASIPQILISIYKMLELAGIGGEHVSPSEKAIEHSPLSELDCLLQEMEHEKPEEVPPDEVAEVPDVTAVPAGRGLDASRSQRRRGREMDEEDLDEDALTRAQKDLVIECIDEMLEANSR